MTMYKKMLMRLPSAVLLVAFLLVVSSSGVFAGNRGTELRRSANLVEVCKIPYNIQDYGYLTGLHIVADWNKPLDFTIDFYCGSNYYATSTRTIGPEGWTGLASDLLPKGYTLRFPTLIFVYSHADPDSAADAPPERFWVTQFLFTSSGFSHQTFASIPF